MALLLYGALTGFSEVFTILPDKAGKWNEATSYSEGTGIPGAGDVVQVLGNTAVSANAADVEFLETNGIASISFDMRKGQERPTLTIDVGADEDVAFSGLITNRAGQAENTYFGAVVKNGAGVLRLTQTTSIYGLRVELTVNDGTLRLPRTAKTSGNWNANYMRATVNEPGVLYLTSGSGIMTSTWFNGGLCGDGTVTNFLSTSTVLYVAAAGPWERDTYAFSGQLGGNVRVYVRTDQTFTSTNGNSTATVHSIQSSRNLSLAAIGGTYGGLSNPGSLGSQAYYNLAAAKPTVTYIGSGETSYAEFRATADFASPFTLNGGPNGGFVHAGAISFSNAPDKSSTIVLDGDHTNACTLASAVKNVATNTTLLVKRGSGTWRLVENDEGVVNGLVTVENGTLAFDALSGTAAIALGTSATTGTLVYAGTAAASVATRPISLMGDGRLTSDAAALDWMGVTAGTADVNTLYVGGAADGIVRNISDGSGTVRVVKEGAGSWTLGGDLDFTGGLDVKAGSLVLSSATNSFTWYRYLIQEARSGTSYIDTARLNFFNDAGEPQATTNTMAANAAAYRATEKLQPGEFVPYTTHPTITLAHLENWTGSNYTADRLFRISNDTGFARLDPNKSTNPTAERFYPQQDDPETWIGYVLRLPAGSDPVTSYDVGSRWKAADNPANIAHSWTLEGSVDGVNWHLLDTVVSNDTASVKYWRFAKKSFFSGTTLNKDGQKILSGIAPTVSLDRGLDDVSVAVGASLSTTMDVVVRKITVDAAGMGALSGVTLAEGGVIDIVNAPARGSFDVTADLTGVTLPADFSLTVNGAVDRRAVSLSPDRQKISVTASGMILIFR